MATELEEATEAAKAVTVSQMKQCIENNADLLKALHHRADLHAVVPIVLDAIECDPLASAGNFRGDLLRALIELPATFWHDDPASFQRYKATVRAGAIARLALPRAERMAFWTNA
jgi:contact-dependent growth inhibition (CDI) system CdiI-like immunity protein